MSNESGNWPVEVRGRAKLPFSVFKVEKIDLSLWLRLPQYVAIGIDPGQVNMGLSVISGSGALAYQIALPSTVDTVERVVQTIEITERLLNGYELKSSLAVVEQAAYAALYGQVALAENRTAAIVGLLRAGVRQVVTVPPGTIRKEVFGSAKLKAEEVWPHVGKDAASSLCCALHAYQLQKGNNE